VAPDLDHRGRDEGLKRSAGIPELSTTATARTRKVRIAATAVAFLVAIIPSGILAVAERDMPLMAVHGDDTLYFAGAKSLAAGVGYRIPSLAGEPFQTKYPPLYPMVLVVWKLNQNFPQNIAYASILAWLFVPLYLATVWAALKRWRVPLAHASVLLIAAGINLFIVMFGLMLMSELFFSTFLLACVLCADRASEENSSRWAVWAGVLGAGAFLVRTSALPLIVSLSACFLFRRQKKQALWSVAPVLAAVIGWTLWSRSRGSEGSDLVSVFQTNYVGQYLYMLHWADVPVLLWANLRELPGAIVTLFMMTGGASVSARLPTFLVIGLTIAGIIRFMGRTKSIQFPMFALAYVVLLTVWNFVPTPRFLLPLLPLLLIGIYSEIMAAIQRIRGQGRNAASVLLSAVILSVLGIVALKYAVTSVSSLTHSLPAYCEQLRQEMQARVSAYRWISEHTSASE
jgi:hypothetical protein